MANNIYKIIEGLRDKGYTWDEVKEYMNDLLGEEKTESAYRKPYAAYKKGQEDSVDKVDLEERLQKIRLGKKELSIERSINNEQIRDLAIRNVISEKIQSAIEPYKKPNGPKEKEPQVFIEENMKVISYFLSDLHYDGSFDLNHTMNVIYNSIANDILKKKKQGVFTGVISINELGDVIEGASLRTSQLMGIKKGMVEQIIEVANAYSDLLYRLYSNKWLDVDRIYFTTVTSSNHTQLRQLGTKQNELIEEDLMLVFAKFIEKRFENLNNIRIDYEEKPTVPVNHFPSNNSRGKQMLLAHGHAGINLNNLEQSVYKQEFYKNLNHKFFAFGHYHHYREIDLSNEGERKKVFLIPSISPKQTDYEKTKMLSVHPAVICMQFDGKTGEHLTTDHILIDYEG